MADASALSDALNGLPTSPLEETFFRIIHAKYAATALSAVGSYQHGGRYNPVGKFEVLYLASSPVTALEEVEALLRSGAALQGVKGPPRILLSVECALQHVLRFDKAVLQTLGLTRFARLDVFKWVKLERGARRCSSRTCSTGMSSPNVLVRCWS